MTAVMTASAMHRLTAFSMRRIRDAHTQAEARTQTFAGMHRGLDDEDLILAILMWEETHPRPGITLTGPEWVCCKKGAGECLACRAISLWERAAALCLSCYGRGAVDTYTVTGQDGSDVDVDVPCDECRGSGSR